MHSSEIAPHSSSLMPVLYVPHGGGPMPLLGEPNHRELVEFLSNETRELPEPKAILLISAHWEEPVATISSAAQPTMIYDYYGFPPESYRLSYKAPGEPHLAQEILNLLQQQGIQARLDPIRGYDHGTFVPLLLMYPNAHIPVVQLSLLDSLDPGAQIDLGTAIAPLREQGVMIIGSGMSFHNMQAFFSDNPNVKGRSQAFDDWLVETLTDTSIAKSERRQRLIHWKDAPESRFSHPREEHLLPLHVCFGAANVSSAVAQRNFGGILLGAQISGFIWR